MRRKSTANRRPKWDKMLIIHLVSECLLKCLHKPGAVDSDVNKLDKVIIIQSLHPRRENIQYVQISK